MKLGVATNISAIADNINIKSSSNTSTVTNSSSSTSDLVYKKQFITFKTPSSRTEMIEKKKVMMNRIRAKQHRGGDDGGEKGGGEGRGVVPL